MLQQNGHNGKRSLFSPPDLKWHKLIERKTVVSRGWKW